MRIVFWGNGARGVACLGRVLAEKFEVVAVVGQTTAPAAACEVLDVAQERGLPYFAPVSAGDPALLAALRGLKPELGAAVPRVRRRLPRGAHRRQGQAQILPATRQPYRQRCFGSECSVMQADTQRTGASGLQ